MGQKRRKKACKTPPSTPKDASETPKTTNHDGTVAPSGRPWPRARGPQRGPQDTLGAPRGPPKQCQTKTQSPLTKNAEDKKRTTKTHPKSDRYLRRFCAPPLRGAAPPLRGAFFGDAAARIKQKNNHFTAVLDPKGCQNARKPCILRGFVNTRLSQRRHSAQIYVVFCALVLYWPPARNRKTRPKTGLKVAVTLVWLLGPRGPPEGARRGPGASKGPQNTTDSWDFQKNTKYKFFENVHPSRVPGPFWPKRVADRTPITKECCVFCRGLESGPREPKERKSAPGRFLKALNKLGPKTGTPKTMCFTR